MSPTTSPTHMRTHTHTHTQFGSNALHLAVQEGHKDVVELLLEAKADPDIPDKVITHGSHVTWTTPNINTGLYTIYRRSGKFRC